MPEKKQRSGSEFLIVDNSDGDWKVCIYWRHHYRTIEQHRGWPDAFITDSEVPEDWESESRGESAEEQ